MHDDPSNTVTTATAATSASHERWPSVSVVLPVRDEAAHLRDAVGSILDQDYDGALEVCLAVAASTDGTEHVAAEIAGADPRVLVVENHDGTTPAGLNAAIAATTGQVVVRVDGHARIPPGYIRRAVSTLRESGAVNVGGIQLAEGTTEFERAVAIAMRSWFGTGGARFHVGGQPGPVDTVYLGVFDRAALTAVGGFDESLIRNQDYELNIRLRRAGGVVWFDPALAVGYRPRGSWSALARQYHEYGIWKYRVAERYPDSLRLRQLVPVIVTLVVLGGAVLAPWRRRAAVAPLGYATAVVAVSIREGSTWAARRRLATVFPTMHLTWGLGFVRSAIGSLARRLRSRAPRRGAAGS